MNESRLSNMELLRIASMFYILLYHFSFQLSNQLIVRAMGVVFHIGVICFVMLSGYFMIKPTVRKFIKLAGTVIFYSLFCLGISCLLGINKLDISSIADTLLLFTSAKYWFVSVYMQLFLVSPMLNVASANLSKRDFLYVLSALAFLCIYMGFFRHNMICIDGKNLLNFIFVYLIGRYIRLYSETFDFLHQKVFFLIYLILTIVLVLAIFVLPEKYSIITMQLFYPYNSPGIYILAILFFLIFVKCSFTNRFVNYVASSTLAVYLLHDNPDINEVIYGVAKELSWNIFFFLAYAVIVFCIAIMIDKLKAFVFRPFCMMCDTLFT